MNVRPPPTSFILPLIGVSLVFSVALGVTAGRAAISLSAETMLQNGIVGSIAGTLMNAFLYAGQAQINRNHWASSPLADPPRISVAVLASTSAILAMTLFLFVR